MNDLWTSNPFLSTTTVPNHAVCAISVWHAWVTKRRRHRSIFGWSTRDGRPGRSFQQEAMFPNLRCPFRHQISVNVMGTGTDFPALRSGRESKQSLTDSKSTLTGPVDKTEGWAGVD
ncbi:hypothetical protein BaRGS_00020714 [Batillaria attramentaria]|uniref:Uncharacterized protein n=1 Tax=Batillaria attramentaria TaxID=370345 RepID=A0ABD0JEP7_9CAEN